MDIINWIKYELMGLPHGEYILKIGDKNGSVSFPVSECVFKYAEKYPKAKIIGLEEHDFL